MLRFVSMLLAGLALACAAPAAELGPYEPCAEGFLPHGRAPEAVYLCSGPKLVCRDGWYVVSVIGGPDAVVAYRCGSRAKPGSGAALATLCTAGFTPSAAEVREGNPYGCGLPGPHIVAHCRRGYAPGPLAFDEWHPPANPPRSHPFDGAAVSYVCAKS